VHHPGPKYDNAIHVSMSSELYLNIVEAALKKNMRELDWIRMILTKYFEIKEKMEEQSGT
jgi:hypothetical protein